MRIKFLKKGFTLIELLIVIAIIAVLTVAFLPTLRGGQAKARDAAKVSLLANIQIILEKMANEGTSLPADGATAPAVGVCIASYSAAPGSAIAGQLGRVPDPNLVVSGVKADLCTGNQIWYNNIDNSSYVLAIQLEEFKNANVETGGTVALIRAANTTAAALALTDETLPTATSTDPLVYLLTK